MTYIKSSDLSSGSSQVVVKRSQKRCCMKKIPYSIHVFIRSDRVFAVCIDNLGLMSIGKGSDHTAYTRLFCPQLLKALFTLTVISQGLVESSSTYESKFALRFCS